MHSGNNPCSFQEKEVASAVVARVKPRAAMGCKEAEMAQSKNGVF